MAGDLVRFREQCEALQQGASSTAELSPIEPELFLSLKSVDRLGHIRLRVEITPDHLRQSHRMEFEIDLSYLPGIVAQCREIESRFPIRGR